MTTQEQDTLLTPELKALVGKSTPVREMYGTVDVETLRRYVVGIPDKDPRHWDEELAKPRFGGVTTPAAMLAYIASRTPPWEEDQMHDLLLEDPYHDSGGGMRASEEALPSIKEVGGTRSHLHAGDEVEVLQYPKLGDRIFYKSAYVDIQEKTGRDGRKFILATRETTYWNQDDDVLLKVRMVGIEHP
jgi:acyl dehydratase